MALREWVKLPSRWIDEHGLHALRWTKGEGANNTAALMALAALAHHAQDETGIAQITYDDLARATGLSRTKLSAGLKVLEALGVIERAGGRSRYQLSNYDLKAGWAKLPARRLYAPDGRIVAFDDFRLRRPAELHALKLYFLFAARRGNDTNMANIGYEKIQVYTGVETHRIKTAITILGMAGLVHVEFSPGSINKYSVANAYRLVGLDSRIHMGTRGRGLDAVELGSGVSGDSVDWSSLMAE